MSPSGEPGGGVDGDRAAILVLFLLAAVTSCQPRSPGPAASRAFYYWRTVFKLDRSEQATLTQHRVARIYLRVFDVKNPPDQRGPVPVAVCRFTEALPAGIGIVPVVAVSNAVFKADPGPGGLATKVWNLTAHMAASAGFKFGELQVDCDWTDSTRAAFFAFCRHLRAICHGHGAILSATIRLHQVKYKGRTGIPPVDRGMLMFYNMGHLRAAPGPNSIFNVPDASRYTDSLDRYPLPLDGALPIFSWALHIREGMLIGLLDKEEAQDLAARSNLVQISDGVYKADRPGYLNGDYLQRGDVLRLETVSPALADRAADLLASSYHPRSPFTIALFDLDAKNLKHYDFQNLENLYTAVR